MRPEAYKNVEFSLPENNDSVMGLTWPVVSYILMCVDMCCLLFFSLTVLSTRGRMLRFVLEAGKNLQGVARVLLNISSYEYMTVCLMCGIFIIVKERLKNKVVTCYINGGILLLIWVFIFFYIWGISRPFIF